jgi:transposase
MPATSAFVAVQVESALPTPAPAPVAPALDVQVRLPNGATLDVHGADLDGVIKLIEGLGRLRCSASTKP